MLDLKFCYPCRETRQLVAGFWAGRIQSFGGDIYHGKGFSVACVFHPFFSSLRFRMSLLTADYDYALPPELIAKHPRERREDARMLVLHRDTESIEHRVFREFPSFLRDGDMVVLNNTKVIPARVFSEDGRIELLLTERIAPSHWRCFVRPGRKLRLGTKIAVAGTTAEVEQVLRDGSRLMAFAVEPDLEKFGAMPLPPYINRAVEP